MVYKLLIYGPRFIFSIIHFFPKLRDGLICLTYEVFEFFLSHCQVSMSSVAFLFTPVLVCPIGAHLTNTCLCKKNEVYHVMIMAKHEQHFFWLLSSLNLFLILFISFTTISIYLSFTQASLRALSVAIHKCMKLNSPEYYTLRSIISLEPSLA